MKTFSLVCERGHGFDLMVKSLDALADQQARGLVTCPYCDSKQVQRSLAKPAVKGGKGRAKAGQVAKEAPLPVASPRGVPSRVELERAYRYVAEMRARVEKTHENVGERFTDQARAMHYGEIDERGIYGEASPQQVKDLLDEGVEVAPLPPLPKMNA